MSEHAADRLTAALADRYRIERELGAGGMATVYLAHDFRHDRKVAIKVLRPELAAVIGAERFLSEIKTTANLQHPHILPLFDSGAADSFLFYVMPYVEGISLRDRMTREKQLPIGEAVRLTTEIASALDYAHRHRVIHRDIKPENILLHDGSALVADFGIALAASKAGTRMTETGMSLGTPQYMSPEQAMGERELDARSDVYALGCVAYEMLTGEPPFSGPTAQAIVAKVMTAEPADATTLRRTIPAQVADAVHTALQKLPADRFASAAEFSLALASTTASPTVATRGRRVAPGARWRTHAPWGVVALALAAGAWGWMRPAAPSNVIRFGLALPANQAMIPGSWTPVPAPDGSYLIYSGPGENGSQLWLKRRDAYAAIPIVGTTGAQSFTVSPDGEWIAFVVNGRLNRIPVAGGTPVLIASDNIGGNFGLAWLDDGTIVYTQRGAAGLMSVPASGGTATVLWQSDTMITLSPSAMAGGHGVLFVACDPGCAVSHLWGIKKPGSPARELVAGASAGALVGSNLLVYSTDAGGMFAVNFDPAALEVSGTPVSLGEQLPTNGGLQLFRVSKSGTLVMLTGGSGAGRLFDMVWVDRDGRETPVDTSWSFRLTALANNHGWSLSPDGTRIAIGLATASGDDIWVKPIPSGAPYRVSLDPLPEYRPRWSPDGRFVTFVGVRQPGGIYQRRADGSGRDSLLMIGTLDEGVISPDGRWLLIRQGSVGAVTGGRNLTRVQLGVDSAPVPLLVTEFDEEAVALSPDGKWMAYQSDETGRTEIFVRPFPEVDDSKQQISSGGAIAPLWSRDGKELFFLSSNGEMMAARRSDAASGPALAAPVTLFRVRDALLGPEATWYTPWDVGRDGRFLMARLVEGGLDVGSGIVVVENWMQELRAKVRK